MVRCPSAGAATIYGKPYQKVWFKHFDIVSGAKIVFQLRATPNKEFAAAEASAPPSMDAFDQQ